MRKIFHKEAHENNGFTMIEVLIVVAILAILIIMAITTLPKQLNKARDSQRKNDLQKIKIAFEHYYNDNGCYPPADVLENCGGGSPADHPLSPYLQQIPCDPLDEKFYLYSPYDSTGGTGTCDGFRVWANLEQNNDPIIERLGCDGATGCGAFDYFESTLGSEAFEYNYGVSEGIPVSTTELEGVPNPTPALTSGFCCSGVCNAWSIGQGSCIDGPYVDYAECVANSICTE